MKKIALLLFPVIGLCTTLQAQQRVGINVTSPTDNLHVDSTVKIGKNNSINSSTPGRKNLLKFGDASYVTIGEEQTDDKLYIRYGDLVFSPSGGVGDGRIGIKTENPTADLHINGTLRIEGNAAAAGRVLTSDATGNATWQAPSGTGIGFRGRLGDDWAVTQAAGEFQLIGFTSEFNDGGGFNASAGTFTAPSAGVYQFTANLNWHEDNTNTGSSLLLLRLYLTRSGSNTIIEQRTDNLINNTSYSFGQSISSIVKLNAGDVITVRVDPQVSFTYYLSGNGSTATRFAGAKLY